MDTVQTKIKQTLIGLGIQPNLTGYRCLIHAIPMYLADPEQPVTKQLYPEVGRKLTPRESGSQVEKHIRYVIAKAWDRGSRDLWDQYFPGGKRPTNSEFIGKIAELAGEREESIG